MADEVSVTISHAAAKGGAAIGSGSLSYQSDMTGADMGSNTMAATTAWVALNTPTAITYPATLSLINLDPTNYVEIAVDSAGTYKFSRLMPGECGHFPGLAAKPYVKSNVAACQIQWWANVV